MPRIEARPGEPLTEAWAYLSPDEAQELLDALQYWVQDGRSDPEWHHHVGEAPGPELTIAIER